jgi:Tol biopolymer transport system component
MLGLSLVCLSVVAGACGGNDGAESAGPVPNIADQADVAAPETAPVARKVDYILDLETGVETPLPEAILRSLGEYRESGGMYAVSNDGSRLAYVVHDGDRPQIFIAGIDGSHVRQVTRDPKGANAPAWSPDATKIAYLRGNGYVHVLTVLDVASGETTQVSDETLAPYQDARGFAQFTPDGSSLLYTSADYRLRTVPADGGRSTLFIGPDGGLSDALHGSLSPDGALVTYMASGDPTPDPARFGDHCGACRFIANADNTDKRVVRWCLSNPAGTWSPDSSRIVCTDPEDGFVYIISAETGSATRVAVGSAAIWINDRTLLVEVV